MPSGLFKPLLLTATPMPQADLPDVNQISGIAKLINDYGSEVVILAVFIIAFLVGFRTILKGFNSSIDEARKTNQSMIEQNHQQNQQLTEALIKLFSDAFTGIMNMKMGNYIPKEESSDANDRKNDSKVDFNLTPTITNSSIFEKAANKVINEIHCDRVAVYTYAATNNSAHSSPFLKCEYELDSDGRTTSLRGSNHQRVPEHTISSIIDKLKSNNEYLVNNAWDQSIITSTRQITNFISGTSIKSFYCKAIKDDRGLFVGFVIAEFNTVQDFTEKATYKKTSAVLQTLIDDLKTVLK